jgi:hypothetical protein
VVSSDSIKRATATSHGRSRLEASEIEVGGAINGPAGFIGKETAGRLLHQGQSANVSAS